MRPINLSMSAFGPYAEEQVVDFRELGDCSFFLIHGPTGSGKTTILDAICFALYGETSGAERTAEQMRSHHTKSGRNTEVTLNFGVGSGLYRINRSLKRERPKKKGGGVVTEPASATLWDRTGLSDDSQFGRVIESDWEKVTVAIEALLGFKSSQFRQVIMLPQDKFQQLLKAGSSEREDILKILFQTEYYERIEQALKNEAGALAVEIRSRRDNRQFILDQAHSKSETELREQQAEKKQQMDAIRAQMETLRAEEQDAQELLRRGEETWRKLEEKETAEVALSQCESRRPEFDQKQMELAHGRQAAELAGAEQALWEQRQEVANVEAEVERARGACERAQEKELQATKTWVEEQGRQDERDAAQHALSGLQSMRVRVGELETARKSLRSADAQVVQARQNQVQSEAKVDTLTEQLGQLQGSLQEAQTVAGGLDACRMAEGNLQRLYAQRQQLTSLGDQLQVANKKRERQEQELHKVEERLKQAEKLLEALEAAWFQGQAAILAQQLEDEQPCPVCGSTTHPYPAKSELTPPSEQDLKQTRQEFERTRDERDRVWGELTSQRARIMGLEENIRNLEESLGATREKSEKQLEREVQAAQGARIKAERALEEVPRLQAQRNQGESQLIQAREALDDAERLLQTRIDAQTSARTLVDERERGIPDELQDPAELDAAERQARKRVEQLVTSFERARDNAAQARQDLAACQARLDELRNSADRAGARVQDQIQQFEQQLLAAQFADEQEYLAAKRPRRVLESLDQEIKDFEGLLRAAQLRVERAHSAARGLIKPDLTTLRVAANQARARVEGVTRQETVLTGELAQIDDWLANLVRIADELQAREKRYEVLGHLSNVANGQNDHKMTFQRFVLAALLDSVLDNASERLQIMSGGRYFFHRPESPIDKRRAGGLDLAVTDLWTGGTVRAVTTLSGGECFCASLALALGLANVVQAYAGGIHLDTIFVDEGFGSLDAESLDLAVRTLEGLREGKRLVGIISHVDSLTERVPRRLEVRADTHGSTAQFIGC